VSARPALTAAGALLALSLSITLRSDGAAIATAQKPDPANTATVSEAREACGTACHKFPPPDVLPRSAWRGTLVRMLLIRDGIPEPAGGLGALASVIPLPADWMRLRRYYESLAPAALPEPEPWPDAGGGSVRFRREPLTRAGVPSTPALANVRFLDIDGDKRLDIVATDMGAGQVFAGIAKDGFALKRIADVPHPARVEQVDLDRDGLQDLLVADLGSFLPADHNNGAVVWLRQEKNGAFTAVRLAEGLARTADARAADFDDDGDLDVIVAVFGWRKTGSIVLLENQTANWAAPKFVARTVDARTGAIHVPIVDLDGNGRPDFVAVLAQEHESVIAFVNAGEGAFKPQTIYAAPHPNWGSSGIEVVDLDGDRDLDVLLTHGDTFDDFVLKPYHGITWLENRGTYPYTPHLLATLPGAHRAQAADLDGDGDLDIAAAAMAGGGDPAIESRLASVVWLEQVKPRVFERHTIEKGTANHATLDAADYDGDGDVDLLVGWFAFGAPTPAWIDRWVNTSRRQ
jgi:hypothetical protein